MIYTKYLIYIYNILSFFLKYTILFFWSNFYQTCVFFSIRPNSEGCNISKGKRFESQIITVHGLLVSIFFHKVYEYLMQKYYISL